MEISEVRVKLVSGNKDDRLKAFCSMTLDNEFVVRDIKVIEGSSGYFVAMPSRKMSDHCSKCGSKNHLKAKYCSNCAAQLPENRMRQDTKGRSKLHADIAHPINADCRKRIQETIVAAFTDELQKAEQPGYKPQEMDTPDEEVPEIV
ncbi:MAG: SpoVG family protein [Planctomycetota bacterium]